MSILLIIPVPLGLTVPVPLRLTVPVPLRLVVPVALLGLPVLALGRVIPAPGLLVWRPRLG